MTDEQRYEKNRERTAPHSDRLAGRFRIYTARGTARPSSRGRGRAYEDQRPSETDKQRRHSCGGYSAKYQK